MMVAKYFDIQDANYFAGNFEPGRTDYYEAYITQQNPVNKRSCYFTFEDSVGKSIEVKRNLSFVEEMMDMEEILTERVLYLMKME